MKQNNVLVFLHIPKAGGTTLRRITERQYNPGELVTLTEDPLHHPEQLKKLSVEERGQIKLIRGHLYFGIHDYLGQPADYFTVVRDPVERILSLYWFFRRVVNNPMHREIMEKKMGVEDFVASEYVQVENHQTRLISGRHGVLDGALEQAMKNLEEHFAVAGTTERFDETVLLLKRRFGWKQPYYRRRNVTRNRPKRKDLPAAVIRLIEARNQLDAELFRYVSRRLDAELARQPRIMADRIRLRRINRLYEILGMILDPIRRILPEPIKRLVRPLLRIGRVRPIR